MHLISPEKIFNLEIWNLRTACHIFMTGRECQNVIIYKRGRDVNLNFIHSFNNFLDTSFFTIYFITFSSNYLISTHFYFFLSNHHIVSYDVILWLRREMLV